VSFTSRGTRRRIVVAKALLQDFLEEKMKLAPEEYTIESEFMGSTLEGLSYKHPFDDVTDKYRDFKTQMPRVHTVLLNSDFVTTEVGTGLVHVAPGCGMFYLQYANAN
jgi:isoleucyl-tRNA synthetase